MDEPRLGIATLRVVECIPKLCLGTIYKHLETASFFKKLGF